MKFGYSNTFILVFHILGAVLAIARGNFPALPTHATALLLSVEIHLKTYRKGSERNKIVFKSL